MGELLQHTAAKREPGSSEIYTRGNALEKSITAILL